MSSSKPDFDVLFVLFSIWWIDFCLFGPHEVLENISRKLLRLIQIDAHITVEFLSELITVINSEYPFEEVNVD